MLSYILQVLKLSVNPSKNLFSITEIILILPSLLLECMEKFSVKNIIFSSSATVYGEENPVPYTEDMKRGTCTNPYGWTKVMMEQILEDAAKADKDMSVVLLRYFNPIGAHESGMNGRRSPGHP